MIMMTLAFTLSATVAAAGAFEDLDALDAQLAAVAAASGGTATPLDRRLRLRRCPQGVTIAGEGQALTVRCPALGWRLRVAMTSTLATRDARPVVRRGDPLVVRTVGDGFVVETAATAGEDGVLGASVRAKLDGGRQVSGVVTGAQEISVGGI